jgi:Tfp pilus assembly protein PilV
VIFYKRHREGAQDAEGFTLVEAVIAVTLIGIGVAGSLTALTHANSVASMSRNSTGAQTAAQNQIDLLLSDSPFNPQKNNPAPDNTQQVPPELTLGTHTYNNIPIYKEPTTGVIVAGTMTTEVVNVSPTYAPTGAVIPMYRATVTVTYTYLKRSYTMKMSTLRVSDI